MGVPSGTGSSSGNKVVYVDTRVATSGPSHTVITRRDKRGSTTYIYRTIYYHVAMTPQQEHVSQVKHSGGTGGTGGANFSSSNEDWVRRRQRFLAAAGYNVTVDGIWGSQSQAAWNKYIGNINNKATAGTTSALTAAEKKIQDFKMRQREAQARAKQSIAAAQRRMEMSRNRLAAFENAQPATDIEATRLKAANQHSDEIERVFTHRRVKLASEYDAYRAVRLRDILRDTPKKGHGFSIREISLIINNPETGWDPTNEADVRGVQEWLKNNGHPNIEVDGQWNTQTNQALMDDLRKNEARERREAIHEIVDQFYDSGILVAGQNAPWWYLLGGKTPTPGELLRLLDRGGFTASLLLRDLYRQMKNPTVQYANFRTEQINRMYESMHSTDFTFDFFNEFMPKPEWAKVGEILMYPGFTPAERQQLSAQLGFLQESTTLTEFQSKIRTYSLLQESIMRAAAQRDSEQGWFGKTMDVVMWPGEWMREALVADIMRIGDFMDDKPNDMSTEEYEQAAKDYINNMDGWKRLIFELTVDPINFVPFGKVFAVGGKGIAKVGEATTMAGYFIRAGDTPLEKVFGGIVVETGKALELTPEARQILRGYRQQAVRHFATPGEMAGVGEHMIASIIRGARTATALKSSALRLAQDGVQLSARHAFRSVDALGGSKMLQNWKVSSKTMKLVNDSTEQAITKLTGPLKEELEEFRSMSGSYYGHQSREVDSQLGRMKKARGYEEIRIQELQEMAMEEAHKAVRAFEAANPRASKAAKEALGMQKYIEVRGMFGNYLRGGSMPRVVNELTGEVVEILESFERRTMMLQEQWSEVLMPRMQDWIERQMDAAGVSLWDEEGNYLFANGDPHIAELRRTLDELSPTVEDYDELLALVEEIGAEGDYAAAFYVKQAKMNKGNKLTEFAGTETFEAKTAKELYDFAQDRITHLDTQANKIRAMREEARATFAPENLQKTLNPTRFVPMAPDVADKFIENEFRRRAARVHNYYESEKAAGFDRGASFVSEKLDEIRADLDKAWQSAGKEHPGKRWDTREYVEESKLYARHIQMTEDELTREYTDLARVGSFPKGPDQEMKRLVFHMRGGFTNPKDVKWDDAIRYFDRRLDKAEDPLVEQTYELSKALKLNHLALKRASDEALPAALRKQFALYQALQQAQTRPLRVIERGITGSLNAWIFVTLPLRPGWVARNVLDNAAKTMLNGALDPRAYMPKQFSKLGKGVESVFDLGLDELRYMAHFLDELMGTDAGKYFDSALSTFWDHNKDVLRRFFNKYNFDVPDVVMSDGILSDFLKPKPKGQYERYARDLMKQGEADVFFDADPELYRKLSDEMFDSNGVKIDPNDIDATFFERVASFRERVFTMMGSKPENFYKAALYRTEYMKQIGKGANEVVAFKKAWKKVEDTLFNYDKVSVTEDNFRIFFPFIQFWRKNTAFWIKSAVRNPWLPYDFYRYQELLSEIHGDLPSWMQRYFKVELPFADMLSVVPGMAWLGDWIGNQEVYFDPINMFSFAPMYRAFKSENPNLAPNRAGLPFISGFADGVQEWGLGFNPFFSRPMMDMGVFNYRAWQQVFPLTSPIQAMTRAWISERWADRILNLDAFLGDPILSVIMRDFGQGAAEETAKNFNYYVQAEMANQALRGETVSRERAEEKMQDFFFVQTLTGYLTGVYVRRMTPEDIWLGKFAEESWLAKMNGGEVDYDNLTDLQQSALNLYYKKKWSPLAFDNYVEQIPVMQGYFRQGTYEQGQRYLQEHPEIISMVDPLYKGKPFSTDSLRNVQMIMDTEVAMNLFTLVDKADLDFDTSKLANDMLVTPELKAFWARNDTDQEIRQRQIQGEYFRFMQQTQDAYFSIPDDDFEAKQGFLAEHPWMQAWWNKNNDDSDEYKAIMNGVNADLREAYFELLGDGPDPDWDAATAFLKEHPFMFEFTSAAKKVDPATGEWLGSGFSRSQHAADYARAKSFLQYYFRLAPAAREAWLNGGSQGAAIVRAYFAKYSSGDSRTGMTQHAKDYLAAKPYLDQYFALPQNKRDEWLHSGSPAAAVVLNYFKKYGKTHQTTRAFNIAGLQSRNAELNARLHFWRVYFSLTPDKRPEYIMEHSEEAGIFVFGIFGDKERAAKRNEYLRRAIANGATAKAAAYMWVKPLLDMFFTLNKKEKGLFMRANPELEWYFDNYANKKSVTGDPALDKILDKYFNLPPGSDERTMMLEKHPELQDFFDSKASPKMKALRNLLEVYFNIPQNERKEFMLKHPEIQEYFDQRAAARDAEKYQLLPFELADPRMQPYYKDTYYVGYAAKREHDKLMFQKAKNLAGDDLAVRRKREPVEE